MAGRRSQAPDNEGQDTTQGEADPNGRLANQREVPGEEQSTDQLGDQVRPETQLDEDNGNRTLSRPKTDPGPVMMHGDNVGEPSTFVHPSRDNGHQPIAKLNPPLEVTRRVATTPPYFTQNSDDVLDTHLMPADHVIHGGASDMYHKEGRNGDGRDPVRERAERTREVAPQSHGPNDPFARQSETAGV